MRILRRDLIGLDVLEPWVNRLANQAGPDGTKEQDPFLVGGNVQAYLRAVHLQLALAPDPPATRSDLLLVIIDRLKQTNPHFLSG
jgi:hypothetical protein